MRYEILAPGGGGLILSNDSAYAAAQAGTGSTLSVTVNPSPYLAGDRGDAVPQFTWYESFLSFDTSVIGSEAIRAAFLSMACSSANWTAANQIRARLFDWGGGLTTADFVPGPNLASLPLLAHCDTAVWTGVAQFTSDDLVANINRSGPTRVVLSTARQEAGTSPGTNRQYGGWLPNTAMLAIVTWDPVPPYPDFPKPLLRTT